MEVYRGRPTDSPPLLSHATIISPCSLQIRQMVNNAQLDQHIVTSPSFSTERRRTAPPASMWDGRAGATHLLLLTCGALRGEQSRFALCYSPVSAVYPVGQLLLAQPETNVRMRYQYGCTVPTCESTNSTSVKCTTKDPRGGLC